MQTLFVADYCFGGGTVAAAAAATQHLPHEGFLLQLKPPKAVQNSFGLSNELNVIRNSVREIRNGCK